MVGKRYGWEFRIITSEFKPYRRQARGGGQDGLWITHAGVVRAVRLLTRGVALPRAAADWPVEGLPFGASECLALDPG